MDAPKPMGTPGLPLGVPTPWTQDAQGPFAIDRAEVLRYLGYQGQQMEPELAARIEAVVAELERTVRPRGVWAVFGVERVHASGTHSETPDAPQEGGGDVGPQGEGELRDPDTSGETVLHLTGSTVELVGRDIQRHLAGARQCVACAVTLGMDVERRLRAAGGQHPLEAAVLDAAASAAVEAAVDALNTEIERRAGAAGLSCTWRFSPGYGDLPLAVQPQLLAALNATRLCGIGVTPTNLLMPTKSVTALIGLFSPADAGETPGAGAAGRRSEDGDRPAGAPPHVQRVDRRPACATCRFAAGCALRARGATCGRRAMT